MRPDPSTPPHPARRLPAALLAVAIACAASPALAADGAAKPAAKPAAAATKPAPRKTAPATPRQQLASEARGLALASRTVEQITAGQLDVAARVLTGTADCEFKQQVQVQAVSGQPGYFQVAYQTRRYLMVPQETQTGAVRLEDRQAGVVWLQIPSKSMLMDAKRGQRMVDSCQHSEQRIAVQAAAEAGQATAAGGLGITAAPAAAGGAAAATAPAPGASGPALAASAPAPATQAAAPLPATAASR